jgi:hypothetical protein
MPKLLVLITYGVVSFGVGLRLFRYADNGLS